MRPDLEVKRQTYQGRRYVILKDPLSLKYFRFEEEEFALLQMLDGQNSADDIQYQFERQYAPQKLSLGELHQFVGMLYRSALVISEGSGQGHELRKRRDENLHRERWGSLTNILAIRYKGFDPDRMLNRLDEYFGWFFSVPAALFFLMLTSAALLLVAAEFDVFQAKLPAFREFFAVQNWFWIAITLAVTKVLHEFGHGLACKRQGGECHEMGVMLLVLTPCLYCNVTDSWMLPSKWRRAAIGAAGMYVEIVIASLATFVWWFSQPGFVNSMSLNVMFVCSVSTLIFNANPLLRYDGYYILSDLVEIPNLRSKSSAILRRKLGHWMLGLPEPHDPFLPPRHHWLFATYSVAAAAYRWLVAFTIFWVLYRMFEPYGLKVIGQIIACFALVTLLVLPMWQLGKFFYIPGRIERVSKLRMTISMAVIGAVLAAIAWIPVPHYVTGSLHIEPRGAAAVYVEVAGNVESIHARANQTVSFGTRLMTLENLDEGLAIAKLEGQLAEKRVLLASLVDSNREGDDSAGLEIGSVKESIATLEATLNKRVTQFEQLVVHAPATGQIIPAVYRPPEYDEDRLETWHGTPLELHNVGAYLDKGTPICHIGDPRRLEAILVIDQSDIEFVVPAQPVEIFVEHLPNRQFKSQVDQISEMEMEENPRGRSRKAGGSATSGAGGRGQPHATSYEISAPLDDEAGVIRVGTKGYGKIRVGRHTLGWRAWRNLCRTFSFEM